MLFFLLLWLFIFTEAGGEISSTNQHVEVQKFLRPGGNISSTTQHTMQQFFIDDEQEDNSTKGFKVFTGNPVKEISHLNYWRRAHTDLEMAPIYRDNLDMDFQPYYDSNYGVRRLSTFVHQLMHLKSNETMHYPYLWLVLFIAGNMTWFPISPRPHMWAEPRISSIAKVLAQKSPSMPNTLFVINIHDEGYCSHRHRCPVPVFSFFKSLASKTMRDVLLPSQLHSYDMLYHFPWDLKIRRALMRAAMQGSMKRNCMRLALHDLSRSNASVAQLMDVGITSNARKTIQINVTQKIAIPDHARYTWLISADGHTASCRFGKILGINSVVLKEESPWIEYYYRSVHPGVHYLQFNRTNFMQVLLDISRNDRKAQAISLAAQRFVYTYLHTGSKLLYMRAALRRYNALFHHEMATLLSRFPRPLPHGFNATDIMRLLKDHVGVGEVMESDDALPLRRLK